MAKFTEGVRPTQDPEYIRSSRGVDALPVDRSWGNLFAGIGDSIGTVANVADQYVQNNIKQDVINGYDTAIDTQGVPEAASAAGRDNTVTFPGQGEFANSAAKLTAAYNAGKISDTYYYSKLEAMSRSLRARYPGYRDQVDSIIEKTTGVNPANAVRRSLLGQLEQIGTRADDQSKFWRGYWKENEKYLTPEDLKELGDMTGDNQAIRNKVINKKGRDYSVEVDRANFALAADQKKVTQEDAMSKATQDVNKSVNDIVGNQLTGKIESLRKMVQDKGGKPLTPEETAQLTSQFNILRDQMKGAILSRLNAPLDPNKPDSPSYASIINDPTKVNQILTQGMARVDDLGEMLKNGDWGALSAQARLIKATEDSNYGRLLQEKPIFGTMQAAQRAIGPQAAGVLFDRQGELLSEAYGALNDFHKAQMITGQGSPSAMIQDHQRAGQKSGAAYKDGLKGLVDTVANPAVPPEARAKAATQIFKDERFLSNFTVKNQTDLYTQFVSPQTLKNMQEIKDSNPEAWKAYTAWAYKNFGNVFKQQIDTVQESNTGSAPAAYNIIWDEKNYQFQVQQTDLGKNNPNASAIQAEVTGVNSAVSSLNRVLKSVGGVAEADGKNVSQELRGFLQGSGFSGSTTRNPGFWGKLRDALSATQGDGTGAIVAGDAIKESKAQIDLDAKAATYAANYGIGLSELIAGGESGGDYNRLVNKTDGTKVVEPSLSNMTVAEVLERQKTMMAEGHPSTAAGKFQIIRGTLQSLVNDGVLNLTDKYNEQTQERAAQGLIQRRWRQAGGDPAKFLRYLGDEWEILKKDPSLRARVADTLLSQAKDDS